MSKWTILVYMAADNNGLNASPDIEAMKAAASGPGLDVLVETVGDGGEMVRWRVTENRQQRLSDPVKVDTGEPQPLTDFIRWGVRESPSDHTALVVWSHGDGLELAPAVLRGTWGSPRALTKHLTVKQLAQSIRASGAKCDVIGLDACLMGMTEVAYELGDLGAFLIASQNDEFCPWPYKEILSKLAGSAATSPEALAGSIVSACGDAFAASGVATTSIASVRLGAPVAKLAGAFLELVKAIDGKPTLMGKVNDARGRTPTLSYHGYVDFKTLLGGLAGLGTAASKVEAVQAALKNAVAACRTSGAAAAPYGGLSLFYPTAPVASMMKLYAGLQFPQYTGWGTGLSALLSPPKKVRRKRRASTRPAPPAH